MAKVNLNILIDEELRQDFKSACAKSGSCMTDVLLNHIVQYIIESLKNEKVPSS